MSSERRNGHKRMAHKQHVERQHRLFSLFNGSGKLSLGAMPICVHPFPSFHAWDTIHSLPRKFLAPNLLSMRPTRQNTALKKQVTHPSTRSTNHISVEDMHIDSTTRRLDDSTAQCTMHISWQLLSAFSLAACFFKGTVATSSSSSHFNLFIRRGSSTKTTFHNDASIFIVQ